MRMLVLGTLALLLAIVTAGVASVSVAEAGAVEETPAAPAQQDTVLSNERTFTRWTYPLQAAHIYSRPSTSSRRIGKTRFYTEDHLPEVYLALRQRRLENGQVWTLIRIPGRPNGRVGWVRRHVLDEFRLNQYRLLINRSTLRATLYHNGTAFWSTVIGVGASGTPTPKGNFYIRERLPNSSGIYGPFAFGTSAYSSLSEWPRGGVIGIHGTNQPSLLPGRVSHGCIRMPNSKIRELRGFIGVGTPVTII